MAKIVNPDGTVTDTSGNFGSGLYLPEVKEQMFGAFGDIQNQTTNEQPFTYGVYQLETQTPENIANLQNVYGTGAMPVFEFVKAIQTGTKTYDPTNSEDVINLNAYQNLIADKGVPAGYPTQEELQKEVIKDTVSAVGTQIGSNIGSAFFDPTLSDLAPAEKFTEGLKSSVGFGTDTFTLSDLSDKGFEKFAGSEENLIFNPKIATKETADRLGFGDIFDQAKASGNAVELEKGVFAFKPNLKGGEVKTGGMTFADGTTTGDLTFGQTEVSNEIRGLTESQQNEYKKIAESGFESKGQEQDRGYTTKLGERFKSDKNIGAGVGAGITSFVVDLISGSDPEKAAKTAVGTGLGTYIGASIGGPIGAIVGGSVGRAVGGRVICNELYRQNLMTKTDVLIDYQYTFKHLTKQHVVGYHTWSIDVVKKMRKGKYVKFWKHVAQHRCNEIKYIMGISNKPDYLGKIYKKILESFCYVIGYFNKAKDYTTLYTGEKHGT